MAYARLQLVCIVPWLLTYVDSRGKNPRLMFWSIRSEIVSMFSVSNVICPPCRDDFSLTQAPFAFCSAPSQTAACFWQQFLTSRTVHRLPNLDTKIREKISDCSGNEQSTAYCTKMAEGDFLQGIPCENSRRRKLERKISGKAEPGPINMGTVHHE